MTAIDTGSVCCVAIELSQTTWVCGVLQPDCVKASVHRLTAGNVPRLIGLLQAAREKAHRSTGQSAQVVVCYEAGYDGFWLARLLSPKAFRLSFSIRQVSSSHAGLGWPKQIVSMPRRWRAPYALGSLAMELSPGQSTLQRSKRRKPSVSSASARTWLRNEHGSLHTSRGCLLCTGCACPASGSAKISRTSWQPSGRVTDESCHHLCDGAWSAWCAESSQAHHAGVVPIRRPLPSYV